MAEQTSMQSRIAAMEMPPKHVRFTHTPLNFKNKEVRLLTIEPSVEPSSSIQVTMKHVDLSRHFAVLDDYQKYLLEQAQKATRAANPRPGFYDGLEDELFEFTALSYTWGPEMPAHDILVTSSESRGWLSIRQNLYDFLQIRRNNGPDWFWIDQICINQGKDDERAHQVNQMANIYSVSLVEVWLGSGFEGSEELMDLIVRESVLSTCIPRPALSVGKEELRRFIPSLRRFVNLPYWSRLWITQEIVLGSFVDVRMGAKAFRLEDFYSGWNRLRAGWESLGITAKDKDLGPYGRGAGERLREIKDTRGKASESRGSVGELVWGTQCSDPRDRVFGALGMVIPSLRIFPDYSMQPQELLLTLLTKQFEAQFANIDKPSRRVNLEDPHSVQNHREEVTRSSRGNCIYAAEAWLPHLDDDKNRIDPRTVRRHLLQLLPAHPSDLRWETGAEWQLKAYLWYRIPDARSKRWRLMQACASSKLLAPIFQDSACKIMSGPPPHRDDPFADDPIMEELGLGRGTVLMRDWSKCRRESRTR